MRLTQGIPEAGSLQSLTDTFSLAGVGTDPQRKYRQTFVLSLPTGGAADGIKFLDATRLRLCLPTLEFDALAAGALESATLTQRGTDKVLVQLPVARTLQRVKAPVANGQSIRAFRTDGEVTAADAFVTVAHTQGSAQLAILDQRVALGLVSGNLLTSHIQQVVIRSPAANPKVGIKIPLLGEDEFFLSGSEGPLLPNPASVTTLDAALLRVLQTLAGRLDSQLAGALLPATLTLHLIVESDTPARLQITLFNLDYSLLRRRFATPASGPPLPKEVLRFDGGSLQARSITLELPKAASFARAELRLSSSFELSSTTAEAPVDESSQILEAGAIAGNQALRLRPGVEIATKVTLVQALLPQGGTVEILGVSGRPKLAVRLYADDADAPGKVLAESSCSVERSGVRQTLRFGFQRSAVVSNQAWLSLTLAESEAAWLLAADAAGSHYSRSSTGAWSPLGGSSRALASLFGSDGSMAAADPLKSFRGVRLRVAGVATPGQLEADEQQHSLLSAVTSVAQSAPGAVVPLQVEVLSSESGQVTVKAPLLEYDVFT
jgi:hypothetical protein